MQRAQLIGIDWGTSNLRVYRIGADGAAFDQYVSGDGLMSIAGGAFAAHLAGVLERWPNSAAAPLIACGMVGSRQGWVEAPYVACPAALSALAGRLAHAELADGRAVHLVPGLSVERDDRAMDVMRGEETAIIGASQAGDGIYCLPGTHAKWARVTDATVTSFATAMTGEVFELMSTHSILGRMLATDAAFEETAFADGVSRAAAAGGLLQQLFTVRTQRLFDRISEQAGGSYLSGILIGSDVQHALGVQNDGVVTIVGVGHLAHAYARAVSALGASPRTLPAQDAIVTGLVRIARAAGLIE